MATLGRSPGAAPLTSADIPDNSITAAKISPDTIVAADLAPDSVDSSELVDGSIDTSHIGANQVTAAKVAADVATQAELEAQRTDSSITTLGTVTAANLSNSAIVYPAGHVVKVTSKVLTGSGNDISVANGSAYDSDANDLDVTATAGNILHIFIAGGRIYSGTGYVAAGIRVEDGGSSSNTDYRKSWAYQAGEIHGAVFQHHTVGGSGSVSLKIKRLVWDKEGGTTIYWNSNEGGVYVSFQVFEVQG